MCLCALALLGRTQHFPLAPELEGRAGYQSQLLAARGPTLSFRHLQQPTRDAVARIMEDSSAGSRTQGEESAAPNPASAASETPLAAAEAPAAPLSAPEASNPLAASEAPPASMTAPPRFDLHAAPDANLNLRLSPSEDAWGGALAFGNADDDPLPLADVPGNPETAALRRKAALYRIPSAAELEAVLPTTEAPAAAPAAAPPKASLLPVADAAAGCCTG